MPPAKKVFSRRVLDESFSLSKADFGLGSFKGPFNRELDFSKRFGGRFFLVVFGSWIFTMISKDRIGSFWIFRISTWFSTELDFLVFLDFGSCSFGFSKDSGLGLSSDLDLDVGFFRTWTWLF